MHAVSLIDVSLHYHPHSFFQEPTTSPHPTPFPTPYPTYAGSMPSLEQVIAHWWFMDTDEPTTYPSASPLVNAPTLAPTLSMDPSSAPSISPTWNPTISHIPTQKPTSTCKGNTPNWSSYEGYGCDYIELWFEPGCPDDGWVKGELGTAWENCCYCQMH